MKKAIVVVVALGLIGATTVEAGVDPALKCQSAKLKAAGQSALATAKCYRKAVLKSRAVDPECLAKAESKLDKAVTKADAAEPCPASAADLEAQVGELVDATVGLTSCSSGTPVGPYCWFVGSAGESCDTVCANNGLAYNPATDEYVGSTGTTEHCDAVLTALGMPYGEFGVGACLARIGCHFDTSTVARARCTNEIIPSHYYGVGRAACACE